MTIWVSSRFHAPDLARKIGARRAVSLLAPYDTFPVLGDLTDDDHLKLALDDVDFAEDGLEPPQKAHVQRLISFVSEWDKSAPLLIHCWAGVSRSSASAFITACAHNPEADEADLARILRKASATAKPNPRIIAFADEILGRDGRMIEAVDGMGSNVFTEQAEPFSIPSAYDTVRGRWV